MTIGSWVRRPDQKWPVTHCGRRLKTRYTPNGIKVAFELERDLDDRGERCRRCR